MPSRCFARLGALALVLLLAAPAAQAQLQGRVTDAETGDPLPGASIYAPDFQIGASTDPDGRYALSLQPGTYRLVVSYVGYQPATRRVVVAQGAGPQAEDFALQASFVEGPAVTVTASAQASDILTTPQSVAVLEGLELARALGASPLDALEDVAGVRLLRTGTSIAKPVIRGLTAQRVLVVRDGVRQEGQGWGDEHAPELDPFDIDRLEVVRGPASLLYGSDALGGVVQASTGALFSRDRPLEGALALQGFTAAQQTGGHLLLGGVSGPWAYEANGSLVRAGDYATPAGVVPNTGFETRSFALRAGRRFGSATVQAEVQTLVNELALFEPDEAEGGLEESPAERFTIGEPFQTVAHDRANLRANIPLDGHRVEVVAGLQQNRRREFEEHGEAEAALKDEGEEPALFLKLTTLTTDVRFHHRPIGRTFGTVGVSAMLQRNETLGEESLIPGGETVNLAAYVSEELVFDGLTLSAGGRLDGRWLDVEANTDLGVTATTQDYLAATGALGVAYTPTDELSLAANLGRAFRAPVLVELFGNGVHEGTTRFEVGDPDLTPESNLSLDGVVRWLTPHVYLEVSGFVNTIDNYIFPRPTAATDPASGFRIFEFDQADARLWGGEVRLDLHPHLVHALGFHVQADLTRSRNLLTDEPLPFTPPARLELAAEWSPEELGPARDVSVRLGPTLVAPQREAAPGEAPVGGYTTWDLSASARFDLGRVVLVPVISVDNLFDTEFVAALSRFRPYGIPDPGRNVRVQLRAEF